jgi:hypothetical protein
VTGQDIPALSSANYGTFSHPAGNIELFLKTLADRGTPVNSKHVVFFIVLQVHFPSHITDMGSMLRELERKLDKPILFLCAEISPSDEADPHDRPMVMFRPF